MRLLSGRYELLEPLGRGGMGMVYRARDRQLERLVAVKVLPAAMLHDEEFRARFRREARAAAGLTHPNIAVVHDTGEDSGPAEPVPYLVMELVEGVTLAELLRQAPPTADEAGRIVVAVLGALEHSHGRGVVHRDIKPANIMVHHADGRLLVKVMDFGIARLMSESATRLTATGTRIGTPSYMSPEQADGRPADARSDLYSVGCVLYELLTGRPPFTGDSPAVVLFGHLHKTPPPPSQLNPCLAPFWDRILLTARAKDPEGRHSDAAAMRQAVEAGSAASTTPPPPAASAPASSAPEQETADPGGGNMPKPPANTPPGGPERSGRMRAPDPAAAPRSHLPGRRSLTALAAAVCLALLAGGGWITWDQLRDPPPSKPSTSAPASPGNGSVPSLEIVATARTRVAIKESATDKIIYNGILTAADPTKRFFTPSLDVAAADGGALQVKIYGKVQSPRPPGQRAEWHVRKPD
jgi:serine/threonine protein kinase